MKDKLSDRTLEEIYEQNAKEKISEKEIDLYITMLNKENLTEFILMPQMYYVLPK